MSLQVKNLYKSYGQKVVVDNLSFSMEEPGVYALLGTNGAGKTTSIRMILDMLAKDSGEVLWKGKPLSIGTCNIGYLAEERGLYPKYALMDQLIYFASLRGIGTVEAKKRIKTWAEKLEIEEYLYPSATFSSNGKPARKQKPKLADQLSKGNQQKVQLMTALISDPELIVFDEPLSGLDPINTDLFKGIIYEEIKKGKYLIMSSHQMATVEEFCTDITILDKSKTVLQGNLNEIKKRYGRINLKIKTEGDITDIIKASGAHLVLQKEDEYTVKLTGNGQSETILTRIIENNIPLITFDLREPSLHEIFVEKVGDVHNER